jgi:L-asparaginase II
MLLSFISTTGEGLLIRRQRIVPEGTRPVFDGAMPHSVPLLRVLRGDVPESLHRGALVLVEDGRPTLVRGDPERVVFYRSTSKPLQALVGITSGAADAFGLDPAELALAAGSHNATDDQVRTARSILEKADVPESALRCGGHWSIDPDLAFRQRQRHEKPLPVFSNCSGKHALMLASAKHLGLDLASYTDSAHPVQQTIRRHVALFCGIGADDVHAATDNCSAPAFAVPLRGMALSLARLGRPDGLPADLQEAARRMARAMRDHPVNVGGPGRFDTDLIQTTGGRVLAKAGAEGVHGVSVPERGLGLAIKVDDGSDRGYRLVVLTLLRRLGLLDDAAFEGLVERQANARVKNFAGLHVATLEVLDT